MYGEYRVEVGDVMDSSTGDYKNFYAIYLPHSCDEWVIGGKAEARQLIVDLEEAIKIFEAHR